MLSNTHIPVPANCQAARSGSGSAALLLPDHLIVIINAAFPQT
jgi:hypothetical protein